MPKRNTDTTVPAKDVVIDDTRGSVGYRLSITKNLGNYESLKVEVGVTLPIETNDATLRRIDELIVIAKEKVTTVIEKEVSDINAIFSQQKH